MLEAAPQRAGLHGQGPGGGASAAMRSEESCEEGGVLEATARGSSASAPASDGGVGSYRGLSVGGAGGAGGYRGLAGGDHAGLPKFRSLGVHSDEPAAPPSFAPSAEEDDRFARSLLGDEPPPRPRRMGARGSGGGDVGL